MSNGRILHLAINEKFIDHAHISFENVAREKNDYLIFFDDHTSYIKNVPHKVVRYRDRLKPWLYQEIGKYDFVVIHSLHPFWVSVVNACPGSVVFVWIGWGYDYYDIIYPDQNKLLLEETLKDKLDHKDAGPRKNIFHLPTWLRSIIEAIKLNPDKISAIEKISLFSPVLPNEYDTVKKHFGGTRFPQETKWNYGSLEEVLLNGFIGRKVSGNNILLGNSASNTSNHRDILGWLKGHKSKLSHRRIICPLSYGDSTYAQRIEDFGLESIGNNFQALRKFMPLQSYLQIIESCSHLIMNHVRQQGVGVIIIMLYLGSTVFLREENPAYRYLKEIGFNIYSIQQLQENFALLNAELSLEQKQKNIDLLYKIWSKQALDNKTSELIDSAMALRAKT